MPRFKLNDTLVLNGRRARIVWLQENPNEIQAMDEYIVEFEDKQRQFVTSSTLEPKQRPPIHDRERNSDPCHG